MNLEPRGCNIKKWSKSKKEKKGNSSHLICWIFSKTKDNTLSLCLWTGLFPHPLMRSEGWVVKHLTCAVKSFKLMAPQTKQRISMLWCNHSLSQCRSVFNGGSLFSPQCHSLYFLYRAVCTLRFLRARTPQRDAYRHTRGARFIFKQAVSVAVVCGNKCAWDNRSGDASGAYRHNQFLNNMGHRQQGFALGVRWQCMTGSEVVT